MSTNINSKNHIAELLALARSKKATQIASQVPIEPPQIATPKTLAERIAAIRAAKIPVINTHVISINTQPDTQPDQLTNVDKYGNTITYNTEQTAFVNLIRSRKSCILIGAAGTGKTTTIRGAVELLIRELGIAPLSNQTTHKHLIAGTPGICCVAYTRRAVNNIKKAMPTELSPNCITIHKLLEYGPVYYEAIDDKGNVKTTMRFEPARNSYNPLPYEIDCLIIDEASMVSIELYSLVMDALSHSMQIIFVGDIEQLPPVFGSAILGYKMLELPTIQLTQVYRQALESPIIRLAHRILSGNPIPVEEYPQWRFPDELTIREWKRSVDADTALLTIAQLIYSYIDAGIYNCEDDAILIPYNKACGTDELNKRIGNYLARKNEAITYEVIAGFIRSYYSVGDKVLYDKEDAIITSIATNPNYFGAKPKTESSTLDYWGNDSSLTTNKYSNQLAPLDDTDVDKYLDALSNNDSSLTREASHIITLRMLDSDTTISINTSGQINSMLFGWALTVHKAQGSEWGKVFLFIHKSHATMIQRELLYTACTRARKELFILCEHDTFTKGILNQRIVGNTLAEKAEYFKGKKENGNSSYIPSNKER